MSVIPQKLLSTARCAFLFALLAGNVARADDSEIFAGDCRSSDSIQKMGATFTAPAFAVNAFDRTRTLDDLYFPIFSPGANFHWDGNVRKYRLRGGDIHDNSTPERLAVDTQSGFFKEGTQSFWSTSADGATVSKGGAASVLPDWNPAHAVARNLYTYIGRNSPSSMVDLTSSDSYKVVASNTAISFAMVGTANQADHDNVINYARGKDLKDQYPEAPDKIYDQQNHRMGDPVHSQPAVVVYGGTPTRQDIDDAVLYVATNDGFLHAIDAKTGVEQWAYIPQELLRDLVRLYDDEPTTPKHYSLDGSIRVLKFDTNGDGVVDPADNDRVILFFGQGRGGSRYYAIDVTYKKPQFMWAIGPATAGLRSIGQTWSTPTIARVNISDATQNSQKLVLIFGGGYDTAEESVAYQAADTRGNAIYMVDALKGTVLWSASSSSANRTLERMDHAIPSDVTVLDLDGDGYADRMYVGDMAAQVWRFDIFNGKPADELVAGGVIASLGAHDEATNTNAATRRFYNAPDVAAIRRKGVPPFFNIAIGSGYRGHPLNTETQDRFYSIRDYLPFDRLTQEQYDARNRRILRDQELADVSTNIGFNATPAASKTVATNAPGWRVLLNMSGTSWVGEKVLASATTFNGQILFPTYTPGNTVSSDCMAGLGTNQIYVLDVFDGSGHYAKLSQGGIAPQVVFLFPEQKTHGGGGGNSPQTPHYRPLVCLSGAEVLGACKNFNPLVKTYWSESDAK